MKRVDLINLIGGRVLEWTGGPVQRTVAKRRGTETRGGSCNGVDLTWNNWLAVNEIPRRLLWIIILCLLAFFATCLTTTLLLFILTNGVVQPQRNVELVGYYCAGEIPTICKIQTERNGSYHSSSHRSKFCSKTICFRSRILFSRTSALQSGIHRDEKEGTSIDDEFTKQKLITYMWLCLIFIVNSRCSTRVVNIQFNCDCANNKGKNDAYFQFISLSSRIWCIQASRLLEINEFWKINLFCNPSHQFTM